MGGSQVKSTIRACCADVLLRKETHPDCWRLTVRMQMLMRNLLSPVSHVLALILISLD